MSVKLSMDVPNTSNIMLLARLKTVIFVNILVHENIHCSKNITSLLKCILQENIE